MDAMEQLSCDCTVTPYVNPGDLDPSATLMIPSCPPYTCMKDDDDDDDRKRRKRDISEDCIGGQPSRKIACSYHYIPRR